MKGRISYHWADVGSRLGENTSPVGEVLLLIALNGGSPGLIEVIEDNIGVCDDQISVEVVNQVVANGEVDPLLLVDEGSAVSLGGLNNLELILGADTAWKLA